MRAIRVTLVIVAFAAVSGSAQEIKSTTRMRIAPAGADFPAREITDQGVLALSNVFAGAFIGEPAAAPQLSLPRYTVSFDTQSRGGVKEDAYVVQYCIDRATGDAFIYLPGYGEPSYRRNVSTILREGQDGHWHRASPDWSRAIQPYLP